MRTIYIDESGQTGTRLLDNEQRVFSIGSTDLTVDEARALLREVLPRHADGDLKFRNLLRRRGNDRALVRFAEVAGQMPDRFYCYVADKPYATLGRMVDWLVEPVVRAAGYDFYRDDYARKWTNSFWFSFQAVGQPELRGRLLAAYEMFARAPSRDTLSKFERVCADILQQGSPVVGEFVNMVLTGLGTVGRHYLEDDAPEMNDIHVTCVVNAVAWWSGQTDVELELVHDESKHFFQRAEIWNRISALSVKNLNVTVGEKAFGLPLRVASTLSGNSAMLAPLKVCDLIAGFGAKIVEGPRNDGERDVIATMLEAGMSELTANMLRFSGDFAAGEPSIADGPDVIDRISQAVYHHG